MGRPNRKWQLLGVAGALGLVVAVCLLAPGPGWKTPPPKPPPPPSPTGPGGPQKPKASLGNLPVKIEDGIGRVGNPATKVKIEVYYPGHGGCGNETADFAYRVYEANKGKVHVVFVDFDSGKGQEYQSKAGMHCSGIAINGQQEFEVRDADGKKKTINVGSNVGDRWGEEEFFTALDVAFKGAYGGAANHKLPASKASGSGHGPAQLGSPTGSAKAEKSGGGP